MSLNTTEHQHQVAVIDWCELVGRRKYPMLKWIYAVPNGARVRPKTANDLKAEGMKAGVPDLVLPYPKFNYKSEDIPGGGSRAVEIFRYHGLYIEMKSKDTKGRVSKDQKEWIAYLLSVGYHVEVCWNADEAIKAIEDYLNG